MVFVLVTVITLPIIFTIAHRVTTEMVKTAQIKHAILFPVSSTYLKTCDAACENSPCQFTVLKQSSRDLKQMKHFPPGLLEGKVLILVHKFVKQFSH